MLSTMKLASSSFVEIVRLRSFSKLGRRVRDRVLSSDILWVLEMKRIHVCCVSNSKDRNGTKVNLRTGEMRGNCPNMPKQHFATRHTST